MRRRASSRSRRSRPRWLLQLLGLPAGSAVGFATGATMANFTCLAAARGRVLERVGWDVAIDGLSGAPRVRVLVGEEGHGSVDLALRYLGLGAPERVAADDQGRMDAGALGDALAGEDGPTIVCLQAGNVHSGAFDPFVPAVAAARRAGAWVHVDGAFGLWAAASPSLAALTAGVADADSWATDAHKTLNTPYDCGMAVVADAAAAQHAMGLHASYLLTPSTVDPLETVPEISRRARGVPVWAALASLGSDGVRELVDGLASGARGIAEGIARIPGAEVLNDVVYTQVCVAFGPDERTLAVFRALLDDGVVMPSASVWHGRAVLRFSVSNWRTGSAEVSADGGRRRAGRPHRRRSREERGRTAVTRPTRGFLGRRRDATRACPRGSTTSAPTGRSSPPSRRRGSAPETWSITVDGRVESPTTWTWDEAHALPPLGVPRRHPLRDHVVEVRHAVRRRQRRHPARGGPADRRGALRHGDVQDRLHDEPAARARHRRQGVGGVGVRRQAAADRARRPGAAARAAPLLLEEREVGHQADAA